MINGFQVGQQSQWLDDVRLQDELYNTMTKLLEGKVAVVTGGTRGIGYAIVKTYLQQGAAVVLCGSRKQTARAALEKLRSELPDARVDAIWPDLSDEKAVKTAFDSVKEKFGSLDILANNAGISQNCPLDQYTEEEVDKILNINIKSVFVCAKVAAAIMKEQGGGVIINTSSVVSFNGQGAGCLYPTSKYAVNGLTRSLSRELGPFGIRVNAVAPGITRTDMLSVLPDEMIKPLIERIPLRKITEPQDIANAYLFLASDLASCVSGAILPVDGAMVI